MEFLLFFQNEDGSSQPVPSMTDFASMSEEEQIAMAMQMSLQAEQAAASSSAAPINPPGAPKKPAKRKEENDNKNNSEDRKRPRESEGSSSSNPTTPGRQGKPILRAQKICLFVCVEAALVNHSVF